MLSLILANFLTNAGETFRDDFEATRPVPVFMRNVQIGDIALQVKVTDTNQIATVWHHFSNHSNTVFCLAKQSFDNIKNDNFDSFARQQEGFCINFDKMLSDAGSSTVTVVTPAILTAKTTYFVLVSTQEASGTQLRETATISTR